MKAIMKLVTRGGGFNECIFLLGKIPAEISGEGVASQQEVVDLDLN
jgi:hypothetical protein